MPIKKIYLIRHGQTDFNLQGIVQGSGINSSLNATGRAQAHAFFETHKNIPFDKIYTSTLKRTEESVEEFIQQGIPHQALSALNEISWGVNEGRKITPDEDDYYQWILNEWRNEKTSVRFEGGESPEDVAARQQPMLEQLLHTNGEEIILICSHGRAMRILLCQLLHYPLKSMDTFEHSNLCLYLLDYTGSMMTVKKINDVSHLQNLVVTASQVAAVR